MPIKIYWGAPGSYKTSSAVMDDVSTCAAQGRVLITNVRGLSESRIRENAPNCAPGFELIHLRNDVPEQLEKLRRWWHWAPPGAFLILDEVQAVYPPEWTRADVAALTMKEDRVIGENVLAKDLGLIFDMHRHGNWDLTFTTPSIKKVRPEIRAAAECAYKHKNMAIHGSIFRGKFLQMQHLAEDNGNASDIYIKRQRKISPWVFKCYDSTATGKVTDTKVGLSLFSDPKLLAFLAVVVLAVGAIVYRGPPKMFFPGDEAPAQVGSVPAPASTGGVPGTPAADGVRPPVGPAVAPHKVEYRVIGVFRYREASVGYALLYDGDGNDLRVPMTACRHDRYSGWYCNWDGQVVTERTGKAPPRPDPAPIFTVSAPSISS